MAQKVQYLLIDDLDGGEANETVTFGLDGVSYEIDLSEANAAKLREALERFTTAGRKTGGRLARGRGKGGGAAIRGNDTAQIRSWAKENGYTVNARGRVSAQIREAYEKAHS
ncbi:hypothetical protein BIV57_11720 [Mangrovactinospora gilvigrisea]|uniref:Lsr2 family protein n=1 Tax=Mangrovactinospora gilvigrisea TaxID=1428644 RepID=A0A1J7BF88_9ACTN|nr:Lsr2 family protein [Mangrovactinospora gilvigrisea]OIV37310.1 hypothetical protein BIV57_11720 [Mangrovactinospora gilvigrisea]